MRRDIAGALGALALACPIPAAADPLTLDTLLGLETFGRVALSPSGAVAVFEERRARGDLPRYDTQPEGALRYARLYRFDPADPERVRPVVPMDDDAGYTMGPFSPDGRRLVVFRLQDLNFRIGVVDIETDAVSWMDITPETGAWGRSVQWISASEFLVLGMPRGDLPPRLADLMTTQLHLPDLWARASRGEPAFISVGRDPGEADRPVRALWRVDAASGQARLLSEGPFLDFEASPDSRHAALIVDGPLLALPDPETATQVRRARWLRLVDVRSSAVIDPAEARDISTGLLVWAPGSDAVLVTVIGTQPAKVLSISVSGAARDVTPAGVRPDADIDSHGNPTTHAGWLGETPVVRGRLGDLSGWHIQKGAETFTVAGLTGSARLAAQGDRGALFVDAGRVARLHPDATLEDLGAPKIFKDIAEYPRGVVLVTGPTGSGKSTTLAAMINHINENDHAHILTVEDPIEFVHESKKCLINQREVGPQTLSFANALRSALREDPDVILVGEMRDLETIRLALTGAETGHLVFGTLHTSSAAKTIDRVVDVFPAAEKEMVRSMLSESLRAVISQTLLKTKDGQGRCAAHEIMIGTPAIRNLIRENKVAQMYSAIQTGAQLGMQTLDQNLLDLVRRNVVSSAEARGKAANKENFPGV